MKCEKCGAAATIHRTDLGGGNPVREYHLCPSCFATFSPSPGTKAAVEATQTSALDKDFLVGSILAYLLANGGSFKVKAEEAEEAGAFAENEASELIRKMEQRGWLPPQADE